MKNIYKYLVSIIAILFAGRLFSETPKFIPKFNEIQKLGYYYNETVPSNLGGSQAEILLFNIFFVLAGFLFIVALIVALVAAIRLFISSNSEEDFGKWRDTLLWSILGLFLVAVSYAFVKTLSYTVFNDGDGGVELNVGTFYDATVYIIYPILNFLRYIAAICFFCVIVYAFYRIIFAVGDEEGFQNGKRIFITATIGFIIMLLAEPIVRMAYGGGDCGGRKLFGLPTECTNRVFDTSTFFDTVVKIIIFLNGFIALITVLMIMYAGVLVLTGGGDEEKSEKAKKIITYAIIGVLIIVFSYAIYRALLFNMS